MKNKISFSMMLLGMGAIVALTACQKNDSGPDVPKVSRKSVMGSSNQIGFFPDGHQATPISDEEFARISKIAEGATAVTGATGVLTADSQGLNDKNRISLESSEISEMVQATLKSQAIQNLISNPDDLSAQIQKQLNMNKENQDKLSGEIKSGCQITTSGQPQNSGTQNDMHMSGTMTTTISSNGIGSCPVSTRTEVNMDISGHKISDKIAHVQGNVSLVYVASLESSASHYRDLFDFQNDNFKASIGFDAVGSDQSAEMSANVDADGQVVTASGEIVQVRLVSDIYGAGKQSSSDSSATAASILVSASMKTNATEALLQIQVKKEAGQQQAVVDVYLNGKKLETK